MEAKSGLNIFTGVGNIYFKKPTINKSGQQSEPVVSNSSRFDLCKNRFTFVDKQPCPEVVLPKIYKPENFMSTGNIKIADKATCLKNMETAGINEGKLEANLEECSCFDGDENWEHYRFYPEYERYTNLIVYFMIAVCLWIFIAMAYFIFHEVDEEFEEYSKKTYDNSMKGMFKQGANKIYKKANTVFRQSTISGSLNFSLSGGAGGKLSTVSNKSRVDKAGFLTLGRNSNSGNTQSKTSNLSNKDNDERRDTGISIKVPSTVKKDKEEGEDKFNDNKKPAPIKCRNPAGRDTLQIQSVLNENAAKRRVSLKISRYHLDEHLAPDQYEKLCDDMYQQHRESFSIRRPSQLPSANSALKMKINEFKESEKK
jgi:hypothetical protein